MAHVLARAFRVRIDDRSAKVRARIPDDDVDRQWRSTSAIDASSHAMGAPCDPLDMMQSFCGANGRVAMQRHHDGAAPCDFRPLPPPNPYGFRACDASNRVYFGSREGTSFIVADVAEMTDDQRLHLQKRMGIAAATPLRTIAAWRAALR